jgi:hypothetical protein
MEIHCIYTYEDSIMKSNKPCLKGGGQRENGNIIERVNLIKVQHIYVGMELSQ